MHNSASVNHCTNKGVNGCLTADTGGRLGWWHDAWKVRQHWRYNRAEIAYRSGEYNGPLIEIIEQESGEYHLRSIPDRLHKNNLEELPDEAPPWPNSF